MKTLAQAASDRFGVCLSGEWAHSPSRCSELAAAAVRILSNIIGPGVVIVPDAGAAVHPADHRRRC